MSNGENWFGRFVRPPVQVTEPVNLETNWRLPILKAWVGVTVSIFIFGLGLVWSLWITPQDVAATIAQFIFAFGCASSFWYGVVARGMIQGEKDVATMGFVASTLYALLIWRVGELPDSWWVIQPVWFGNGLLDALQYVICLALMAGGGLGAYWFVKEIREPYELTGRERLAYKMWQAEQQRAEIASVDDKTWFIQARIEDERGKKKDIGLQFKKVHPDNFATWAKNILEMQEPNFTYDKWAGRGKLFSRLQYDEITEELVRRGVLSKEGNADNSTFRITRAGRALLCEWLNEYDDST